MYTSVESNIESKLNWAKDYLKLRSIPNPEIDAELILSHAKGDALKFERLIYLRGTRYPLQYIVGSVNFMGLEFKIKPGVFIPRPETELLVETLLNTIHNTPYTIHHTRILDLCTGCGNIAISLAKSLKTPKIIASDISNESIVVAEENMKLHRCEGIRLVKSNLFENIDENPFDIIVSNPPYVSEADFGKLIPELLYEPRFSLYGGRDGLQFYKRIFEQVPLFLKKDGYLIIEIGYNQRNLIKKLLDSKKFFLQEVVKDYNGIDRIMVIKRSPNLRNEMP